MEITHGSGQGSDVPNEKEDEKERGAGGPGEGCRTSQLYWQSWLSPLVVQLWNVPLY